LISAKVKVLGKVALDLLAIDRLCGPALGKLLGDVARSGDIVLMAGNQDSILGRDQVRLDEVGSIIDCEFIRRDRVLGPVAGGAAMADHERQAAAQGRIIRCWHVLRLRCRDDADSGRDAYDGGKYQSERVCHLPVPMDA
jgi:hypothetical protein